MFDLLLNPDNLIVLLTQRTLVRQIPRWLQSLDRHTPFVLTALLPLLVVDSLDTPSDSSNWPNIVFGSMNSLLFALYLLVVLRLTIGGAAVGLLIKRSTHELLITTPMTTGRIIFDIWRFTVYRLRFWILVLILGWVLGGLMQTVLFTRYRPEDSSMVTLLTILCFLLSIFLLCISSAIGIGAAAGMAFHRRGMVVATLTAFIVQFIPTITVIAVLFFSNSYQPLRLDFILNSLILHYTFIAFGDGGLTAVARLAMLGVSDSNGDMSILGMHPRVFLPIICTFHVQLLLLLGAATALALQLRPNTWHFAAARPAKLLKGIDGILPCVLFIGAAMTLVILWLTIPRMPLTFDVPPFPYINRDLLRAMQVLMAFVLTMCTLRAITAGVSATAAVGSGDRLRQFVSAARSSVSRLRVWIFGLSILLMLLFVLLVIDHYLNHLGLRALAASEAYLFKWDLLAPSRVSPIYNFFAHWNAFQVIVALFWSIIMGYGVIIGGVVLGAGARLLWRRPWLAWTAAVLLRALPVLIGLLPPNFFTLPHPGLLATRLDRDPLFTIADSGLTVLIGLAEPGWSPYDHCGLTLASFGVILGVMTLYGLLLVVILPLAISWLRTWRPWHYFARRSSI